MRAEARALARARSGGSTRTRDDLTEKNAISAARDAIQARIQREHNRPEFTYTVILEQPADATSLRDAYAPYVAADVPWESIEPKPRATSRGATRRPPTRGPPSTQGSRGQGRENECAHPRHRALAEPAKRLCWFMSTVQYSHNAIEEVRLGEGQEGDFATFDTWAQELELVLKAGRGAPSRLRGGVAAGEGLYPPRTRGIGRGACCSSSSRRMTSALFLSARMRCVSHGTRIRS